MVGMSVDLLKSIWFTFYIDNLSGINERADTIAEVTFAGKEIGIDFPKDD